MIILTNEDKVILNKFYKKSRFYRQNRLFLAMRDKQLTNQNHSSYVDFAKSRINEALKNNHYDSSYELSPLNYRQVY